LNKNKIEFNVIGYYLGRILPIFDEQQIMFYTWVDSRDTRMDILVEEFKKISLTGYFPICPSAR